VLERLYGRALQVKEHWRIAQELIPEKRPGDFNQAMMELGATVCTPAAPCCGDCPVRGFCSAKQALRREVQKPRSRRKLFYVLDQKDGSVKLVKRGSHERLMPSMFELPEAKSGGEAEFCLKHSITITDYQVLVWRAKSRRGKYVRSSELHELPLTGLTRKILKRTGLMS
jgi:A/G-specific adenine glycosylase